MQGLLFFIKRNNTLNKPKKVNGENVTRLLYRNSSVLSTEVRVNHESLWKDKAVMVNTFCNDFRQITVIGHCTTFLKKSVVNDTGGRINNVI